MGSYQNNDDSKQTHENEETTVAVDNKITLYYYSTVDHQWIKRIIYNLYKHNTLVILLVSILFGYIYLDIFEKSYDPTSLDSIQRKYSRQDPILWQAIESGVYDVLTLNRPSTFILLYEPETQNVIDNIVKDISSYITWNLINEDVKPIILTPQILNAPPFSNDYGEIIRKYEMELKSKRLMIIKNLEKLAGEPAQAFHVICDEYSPLEPKSIIIFTLKVDQFTENDNLYLKNLLQKQWHTIDEDTFLPLFTRITSMVLRIHPIEKQEVDVCSFCGVMNFLTYGIYMLGFIILLQQFYNSYGFLFWLIENYPEFYETILRNLWTVSHSDQFFLLTDRADFKMDVIEYIKEVTNVNNSIVLKEKNFKNIDKFYNQNRRNLEDGCVVVIEKIENLQEFLYRSFQENENIKSLSKQKQIILIYTVEDPSYFSKDLSYFLKREFLNLIPTKKVLKCL